MLEEMGTVKAVDNNAGKQVIWVETQIKSTCGSCEARSNCGTGAIAKVFANKRESIKFQYDGLVTIGQQVKLGIAEESVLKASIIVYILPLLVLILSALMAQSIFPLFGLNAEIWIILFAFCAAAAAYKFIHRYLNKQSCEHFTPKILSVYPVEQQNIRFKQL
ncbi:SoxR reducing system RseC family protein [Paraglaciecola aquimarina]|uniref:SoxR reducing system RseC family protein n=1 Tax=Paraglaciecola aquimarina TaxID=1235557 RepID=A0ABU3SWK2_9ALTE|nr:SoxR reducing system RseC family protein [Paraglaciecola aquimarina]MDU0354384.1 SoxR reducing system RseC family protein [Paraglaciecola aquimarina]